MLQKKTDWIELDIVRGIAVIMMLINHAAVRWLDDHGNTAGISGLLSFIGSYAPVLFFLATGIGFGISHRAGYHSDYRHVLMKTAILIIMDGFMRHRITIISGWDFLAFIAFSMLILQLLRGQQHATLKAIFAATFFVLFRFAGAQLYTRYGLETSGIYWLDKVIGMQGIPGVSYWFSPWLTYPLIGFVIGTMMTKLNIPIRREKNIFSLAAIAIGLAIGLASIYLHGKGAIYFRWGTMSVNYFILSFSVIAFSLGITFFFSLFPRFDIVMQFISMRGISSLAVVPVHYFLLGLFDIFTPGNHTPLFFYIVLPFFLFICMFIAKVINYHTTKLSARLTPAYSWFLLLVPIACAIILSYNVKILIAETITLLAQLILCQILSGSVSTFLPANKESHGSS